MQAAVSLTSRRTRRVLIALLVLLLILLPLYLWPLRGGLGSLPGAAGVSGVVGDPRSAAALARIPAHVWDALMGYANTPPPSLPPKPGPRNLTMIAQMEETGGLDEGVYPSALARGMHAPPDLSSGVFSGDPGDVSPPGALAELLAESPQGGGGTGNPPGAFAPGGPWPGGTPGGGPRLSSPGPTLDPGAPADLAPTPEPATLVLLGSNLALVGAAAWRRRRRRLETAPTG